MEGTQSPRVIETVVPPCATQGTLRVYWNDGDQEPAPIELKIGHLDPPDLPTGYQARLTSRAEDRRVPRQALRESEKGDRLLGRDWPTLWQLLRHRPAW